MNPLLGTLLFLVMVSATPVTIYLAIRTRNKKSQAKQDTVAALAVELGGQYAVGGTPFEEDAIGVFKNAPMSHVISFSDSGSIIKFFIMSPFTGEGSKTTAYKYIAHRMYYTIPFKSIEREQHMYLSSRATDMAKKTPGSLTSLNIPTGNLQPTESIMASHTIYAEHGEFPANILTPSLLDTLKRHFSDCDIELVNGYLYVIGFCGNKVEETGTYKPFIEKCRQHIPTTLS